jgi:hypothetical protein
MAKYYLNANGDYVFTAEYHLARGFCCENDCLHCPYGRTLSKFPPKLEDLDLKDFARLSFFGLSGKIDLKAIRFKGHFCGFFDYQNELFYIEDRFLNQGIEESIILHHRLV